MRINKKWNEMNLSATFHIDDNLSTNIIIIMLKQKLNLFMDNEKKNE